MEILDRLKSSTSNEEENMKDKYSNKNKLIYQL